MPRAFFRAASVNRFRESLRLVLDLQSVAPAEGVKTANTNKKAVSETLKALKPTDPKSICRECLSAPRPTRRGNANLNVMSQLS
jgi:hypothetical protein